MPRFRGEDAWREHPSLQVGFKGMFPNFGRAVRIFAVLFVVEKTYQLMTTPIDSESSYDTKRVKFGEREVGKKPELLRGAKSLHDH